MWTPSIPISRIAVLTQSRPTRNSSPPPKGTSDFPPPIKNQELCSKTCLMTHDPQLALQFVVETFRAAGFYKIVLWNYG